MSSTFGRDSQILSFINPPTDDQSVHRSFYSLGCWCASCLCPANSLSYIFSIRYPVTVSRPFTTAGNRRHDINVIHIWFIPPMGILCRTYWEITYLRQAHSALLSSYIHRMAALTYWKTFPSADLREDEENLLPYFTQRAHLVIMLTVLRSHILISVV